MRSTLSRRDTLKLGGAAVLLAMTRGGCARAAELAGPAASLALPGAFAGGEYSLPALPYGYDARLEPLYDARTLRIHHGRHHAGYVKGLNKTLGELAAAREAGQYAAIKSLSRNLAFHGSGHVLHTLLWNSMTPGGSDVPDSLGKAMARSFGSIEAARRQFVEATNAVEASGWGVLAYEPVGGRLIVLQAEKHQNLTFWGVVPLLVCDVWEHAYYLQFANDRGAWVNNFMKLANWQFAAEHTPPAEQCKSP